MAQARDTAVPAEIGKARSAIRGSEVSGIGLVSVRLPVSLLAEFRAAAERGRIDVHEAARQVAAGLPGLSAADLLALPDPPGESAGERTSLYVGTRALDVLTILQNSTRLSRSTIFRRALYGLLVSRSLVFVQRGGNSRVLYLAKEQNSRDASASLPGHGETASSQHRSGT